jgi:hypothetical protein
LLVVALGGSASAGKTTCAAELSRLLGLREVVHVDNLSRRLQRDTGPHFLDTLEAPWRQPAPRLTAGLIDWTARLHPLIAGAAGRLAATGGIIEGEGVDPRLAGTWGVAEVRTVYVIELDREALWDTFATRASGARFLALSPGEQATVVEMNRLYAAWLRDAAAAAGEPWVWSQPWETLPQRCAEAVSGGGRGPARR